MIKSQLKFYHSEIVIASIWCVFLPDTHLCVDLSMYACIHSCVCVFVLKNQCNLVVNSTLESDSLRFQYWPCYFI